MNARPPQTVDILKQLIAFPTISRDSNLELIDWVRAYLENLDVQCILTFDGAGKKANLFATIGETRPGGLVLSGHTDVVPVSDQAWSQDPFKAELRDGRIYGRGAADMKGFIASVLAAVPKMCAARLATPIHLAFTYDEEVGCIGVRGLLDDLAARNIAPRGCVIGEPTSMNVVIGHKGGSVYRCTIHGREAHSSLAPRGVNAIEYAARLIVHALAVQENVRLSERPGAEFDIPYTTLSAGVIRGGSASNIVAKHCEFRLDIRNLPWTAPEAVVEEVASFARDVLVPEMRDVAPEADICFEKMGDVPALDTAESAALTKYVAELLGAKASAHYVGFGSEGGLFQRAGIPAVICGPGSIAQAHRPDEYVALDELARCDAFIARLIEREAGGAVTVGWRQ